MQPIHTIEYDLTSALALEIQRDLLRWETRRGWRRDLPTYVGAAAFAALIVAFCLHGSMLPGVGGGLLALLTLFTLVTVVRGLTRARGVVWTALLAQHLPDRRVRVEFDEERVRLDMESIRGEGTWQELDRIVVFPGFWVLQLTNSGQIVVPLGSMTPELEAFIRGKAALVAALIYLTHTS